MVPVKYGQALVLKKDTASWRFFLGIPEKLIGKLTGI
jgi:hypothetical protein